MPKRKMGVSAQIAEEFGLPPEMATPVAGPAPADDEFEFEESPVQECPELPGEPECEPDPTPPAEEPVPVPVPVPVVLNPKPVSRVAQILDIKNETVLLDELRKFENSIYEQAYPLRVLLAKDIHASNVGSIQQHMSEVERWREKVLRWASLAKTFVAHCKSDHFVVKREPGMKITEFDREAYQKKLLAGFLGLDFWLEGLVDSIDSRVNMTKVLLRLDEAGQYHPNAQKVA